MMSSDDKKNGTSPTASSDDSKSNTNAANFKLFLLTAMVVQNSSTVLVGRYTRSAVQKEDLYSVNHLICICELVKVRK